MHIMTQSGWRPIGGPSAPEPRHFYRGTQIHHAKWWSSARSDSYDDLFIWEGQDLRLHPDWGKRSLTSVQSTLFGD